MRKIKEVLRLRFELGLGQRAIARACSISQTTVHEYLKRAEAAKIPWPLPEDWDQERVEKVLFGEPRSIEQLPERVRPDFPALHAQLQQHPHLTLQLAWEEYRQVHPEGYGYSRFCELYGRWRRKQDVVLRQEHKPGEKGFVDWAGATIPVQDPVSGEIWQASLFVMVLGASSYTYAEATRDQQLTAWLSAHMHAFEYFGGVPRLLVPDNPRTGVSRACRYDPDLNPTYQEMAMHYGVGVVPARPYRPRDKAKVEVGVQIAERWIIAALRHHKFFRLEEVNRAIRELLERLNQRPFRKREGSRASLFASIERSALRSLPVERFDMSQWSRARVNIDYHIAFDANFYSVPYTLFQELVEGERRRQPWRSFTRDNVWLRISAVADEARYAPRKSTGRRAIKHIWSGRPRVWCTGRSRSDRTLRSSLPGSWQRSRIRRWVIDRVWALSDSPSSTQRPGWKRPPIAHCGPERAVTRA